MPEPLEYRDRIFIKLGGGTYRWVDLKRFGLTSDVDDLTALRLLTRHVRYRDHYTSEDSSELDSGNLHGPYWVDHIDEASFEPTLAKSAVARLREWANEWGSPDEKNLAELDRTVYPIIETATSVYLLPNLRERAQHEWGRVLGDFLEFVVIDRTDQTLVMVVASDD
ncbi:MAG TPA: hypothetical protein VHT30_05670 [Acidimicrobiales bacterium]|nr:hypothetical protein [Acidimicrobiales bacterium]